LGGLVWSGLVQGEGGEGGRRWVGWGGLTVVVVHDVVDVVDGQAAVGADVAGDTVAGDTVADDLVVEVGFLASLAGDQCCCDVVLGWHVYRGTERGGMGFGTDLC